MTRLSSFGWGLGVRGGGEEERGEEEEEEGGGGQGDKRVKPAFRSVNSNRLSSSHKLKLGGHSFLYAGNR